MPLFKRPLDDRVNPTELHDHIESHLGFVVNTRMHNDAVSYELQRHSLRNYCFLLAKIRPTESVTYDTMSDYKYRIMGLLWYGKRYHHGMVIETYGKSIESHMVEIASALQKDFDNEVPVQVRLFKTPRFK